LIKSALYRDPQPLDAQSHRHKRIKLLEDYSVAKDMHDADTGAVFVDASWPGFNDSEGEPLFDAEGKPTPVLQRALDFLQQFDIEQKRTRQFCQRVLELDLLKDMTLDATLPSGENVKLEGFLTVDEDKLNALPDAVVLELHRSGMLMLLQVHLVSLGNLNALLGRKARRLAPPAAAA
jgi:hypothetical protein